MNLPRISIVTPSFNQAEYLRQTIESVLSQNYPNLEYIIIDGGSTDGSVEIIKEYADRLTYWVSEKDRGQSHAINKGFAQSTGEVFNWLCSDDTLLPGALDAVARSFVETDSLDFVVGKCLFEMDGGNKIIGPDHEHDLNSIPYENLIQQPSCFYRRSLAGGVRLVEEDLHYMMDLDLWAKFIFGGAKCKVISNVISFYRNTGCNKSSLGGMKMVREHDRICRKYDSRWPPLSMAFANTQLRLNVIRHSLRYRWFWSLTAPLWHFNNRMLQLMYGRIQVEMLANHWFTLLWRPWSQEVELKKKSAQHTT